VLASGSLILNDGLPANRSLYEPANLQFEVNTPSTPRKSMKADPLTAEGMVRNPESAG
jgi:hypothetical protein